MIGWRCIQREPRQGGTKSQLSFGYPCSETGIMRRVLWLLLQENGKHFAEYNQVLRLSQ